MARRGENIRKRPDGRWEARYKVGVRPDGKGLYRSVYGKTYKEVKARRMEQLTAPNEETSSKTVPSFQEIAYHWLESESNNVKGATAYRYRYLLQRHILPELGETPVNLITTALLNAFLSKKRSHGRLDGGGPLSASYVRSIALVVQTVITYASKGGHCGNLTEQLIKPQSIKRELPILSISQQQLLVARCRLERDGTAMGVLLSLYGGLRIGEVCALEWSDLDMENHTIRIRKTVSRIQDREHPGKSVLILDTPKTESSRRCVPLCTWMVPMLTELQNRQGGSFVLTPKEQFLSPRTYDDRFHRLLARAGVQKINYHALRHTFATRCVEAGMDVKSLSELLGHANTAVTLNTYVHSSMERKRSQLELLPQ